MKFLSCILVVVLSVAGHASDELRVVASVASISEECPPMRAGVYIGFVVHAPVEYRGLPITMFTVGASRRARRVEFPLGAQFSLPLPAEAVVALKKAKADEARIQEMVDEGVKLEMISQFVASAQIELAKLTTKPVLVEVQ